MKAPLPEFVARYFRCNQDNALAELVQCFTEDAIVHDELRDYRGRAEIAAWMADMKQKYSYRLEVLTHAVSETDVIVRASVTGQLPGNPVQLVYRFEPVDSPIATLEIAMCQ